MIENKQLARFMSMLDKEDQENLWNIIHEINDFTVVCTHDGSFHTDDVTAYAILRLAFDQKTILYRSRDPETWAKASIVFDVGLGLYDHHMEVSKKPYRDVQREHPYSSAGLIWRDYGWLAIESVTKYELSDATISLLWKEIDDNIIFPIDMNDNGIKHGDSNLSIIELLNSFNPGWDEELDTNAQFLEASRVMENFLVRTIFRRLSAIRGENVVIQAYQNRENDFILELPHYVPWKSVFHRHEFLSLYVVYPTDTMWRIDAVSDSNSAFTSKKPLPQAWRGKTEEELREITGIQDICFVHPAGFTGGARSREGVLKMAELSLKGFAND